MFAIALAGLLTILLTVFKAFKALLRPSVRPLKLLAPGTDKLLFKFCGVGAGGSSLILYSSLSFCTVASTSGTNSAKVSVISFARLLNCLGLFLESISFCNSPRAPRPVPCALRLVPRAPQPLPPRRLRGRRRRGPPVACQPAAKRA